jgi:hypothetical protein
MRVDWHNVLRPKDYEFDLLISPAGNQFRVGTDLIARTNGITPNYAERRPGRIAPHNRVPPNNRLA